MRTILALLLMSQTVWAQMMPRPGEEAIGLPLAVGQYVNKDWLCEAAPRAVTAYYTGMGINAIAQCHITEAYTKEDDMITQSCFNPQSGTTFETEMHIEVVNTQTFRWTFDGKTKTYRWCQR